MKLRKNNEGKEYYLSDTYSDYPLQSDDFFFQTEFSDRYDRLANEFFGDPSYWWIIPTINKLPKDTLFPEVGINIRIVADYQAYLDFIEQNNK